MLHQSQRIEEEVRIELRLEVLELALPGGQLGLRSLKLQRMIIEDKAYSKIASIPQQEEIEPPQGDAEKWRFRRKLRRPTTDHLQPKRSPSETKGNVQ